MKKSKESMFEPMIDRTPADEPEMSNVDFLQYLFEITNKEIDRADFDKLPEYWREAVFAFGDSVEDLESVLHWEIHADIIYSSTEEEINNKISYMLLKFNKYEKDKKRIYKDIDECDHESTNVEYNELDLSTFTNKEDLQ